MNFGTDFEHILGQIDHIDPVAYGATRNYADGAVTHLSPYISRGVISTKMVVDRVRERDFPPYKTEKLIQELTWRDYWQQVWRAKGDTINEDLLSPQENVAHKEMPKAVVDATTGITAIDKGILNLYQTGYMHNHLRMYVAALACNVGRSRWNTPATWMYYYLLDGDWASNALSWQWVSGCNSKKKYYANQENINTFFYSDQTHTFLDVSYETLREMPCPEILLDTIPFTLKTNLPENHSIHIATEKPTLLYNYYNMDPLWRKGEDANRVLLLEPSQFGQYPISEKCMDFLLALQKNIPGIQLYVGEFASFKAEYPKTQCIFKEHPLNKHYDGLEDRRDWIFEVHGYFPSFFSYWKKCKKQHIKMAK